MGQPEPLRVLVAEDEEPFLRVLTTVLESTKRFSVFPCGEGEEAVAALRRSQFDLAILDWKMPGMSGLNVLQWINEQKLDTPVIMLTGAGSENIAVEAMKLGAYDYLQKDSFDRNHFPVVVSSVYERYLFKKEKEQRETNTRRLERSLDAFALLSDSLSSFAHELDTKVTTATRLTDVTEQFLQHHLSPQGREHLDVHLENIREEFRTIVAIGNAILSLSKVMNENYLRVQSLYRSEVEIVEKMNDTF